MRLAKMFWFGLAPLIVGTGPLLAVIAFSWATLIQIQSDGLVGVRLLFLAFNCFHRGWLATII